MNTKTTIPITEARKNIFEIAEAVQQPGVHYTLTEKGRPKAVLMSAEEFESWQETVEVMSENPNLLDEIKQVEDECEKGDFITLDELLAQEGYIVADKKKDYEISGSYSKKNTKRAR